MSVTSDSPHSCNFLRFQLFQMSNRRQSVALSTPKIEHVGATGRKEAETVARQLKGSSRKRSATVRLEGLMLKLVRELADTVLRCSEVLIAPLSLELSPDAAGKILGISRPLVVRRMEDGRLPFRYEGKHRRCKLEDVLKLKAAEGKPAASQASITPKSSKTRRTASAREIDDLVLGTTNAPYRRSIAREELAEVLRSGESSRWTVHVATFFTDVRPDLILKFAELHGVPNRKLTSTYAAVSKATGETNPALEMLFERLAPAA